MSLMRSSRGLLLLQQLLQLILLLLAEIIHLQQHVYTQNTRQLLRLLQPILITLRVTTSKRDDAGKDEMMKDYKFLQHICGALPLLLPQPPPLQLHHRRDVDMRDTSHRHANAKYHILQVASHAQGDNKMSQIKLQSDFDVATM